MIGVDTNVLVRFLVEGDDPQQTAVAKALFLGSAVAIAHTVLLETEWVLRRSFKFHRDEIASAFVRLLGLPRVVCDRRDSLLGAIRAFQQGCDFADALHTATSADGVVEFVTFDRDFTNHAKSQALLPPVRLLA